MPRKKASAPEVEPTTEITEEVAGEVQDTAEATEETAIAPNPALQEEQTEAQNEHEADSGSAEVPPEENPKEDPVPVEKTRARKTPASEFAAKEDDSSDEQNITETSPEKRQLHLGVLKLRVDEEDQPEMDEQAITWNELANYNRAKKNFPVIITGLETTKLEGNVVVAYYKEQRILIPMSEMSINLSDDIRHLEGSLNERLTRICNTMLGAEVDVVIKGMDKKNRSVVASRQDAMRRKREKFYLTPLSDGLPHVREGRVVEGRIIAVTPMVARIELFGVEVSMAAAELSWDWISNVSDRFHVGDTINVLIEKLEGDSVDNLKITPNVRSLIPNTSVQNLEKCMAQGRYIGEVTNIHNGVVYLRLKNGVNAIAHTNYDKRNPGKGDVVSFVITRINHDYGNVSGVITRIIKQNI